jgi:hypothetical protein
MGIHENGPGKMPCVDNTTTVESMLEIEEFLVPG